jgi:hypothetical protein
MFNQLTKDTPIDKLPTYLMIASSIKINEYTHSRLKWWKRRQLEKNDIWIMDERLHYQNIVFFNNNRKYNTVYKKMNINEVVMYIPIEEYSKFYLDHKIKICTSIVEMLGVFSIHYTYSEFMSKLISADSYIEYANAKSKINFLNNNKNQVRNNDFKKYNISSCPFLFYSPDNFETEVFKSNEYLIDRIEYLNDYNLRNLVRSRLVGNLCEYNLKYEINFMSSFEISLTSQFYANFGVNFKKSLNKKLNVSLDILFFRNRDLINSDNMCIDNNRCLQLILKGPSPNNYYETLFQNHLQKDKSDTGQHLELNPITENTNNELNKDILLFNFVDKYIEEKYKQKDDTDDNRSYYTFYNFIKIADKTLLESYIKQVRNLDDLEENGIFFLKLRSTAFASLIPFSDNGLKIIQNIYLNIFRQNCQINKIDNICYDFRCNHVNCQSPTKLLKRIYIYIIRVYNNACPENIITVEFDIDERLTKILHNITINIVILTNFSIFETFVKKEIQRYLSTNILLM